MMTMWQGGMHDDEGHPKIHNKHNNGGQTAMAGYCITVITLLIFYHSAETL